MPKSQKRKSKALDMLSDVTPTGHMTESELEMHRILMNIRALISEPEDHAPPEGTKLN